MASVELFQLHKTYSNGHHAVKGINLTIGDGEFVVLVGPSGCGKSTALRMVAGLETPTGGEVRIDGRAVNDIPPSDRDVAMVFQSYALYPHMTVRANMAMALQLRGVAKATIDSRVREAARMLAIEELLERKPGQLSGGQRQRVAVGRAIVREPKVALFDEPLSNLDAKLRVATRGELKTLHARLKTTSIYVTHDQEEAMTLGERIVVMHQGQIQQAGPPMDVYRTPANRFVAAFIGMPPMNFLEGHIAAHDDAMTFASAGLTLRLPRSIGTMDAALRSRLGQGVTVGLRPQTLALVPDSNLRHSASECGFSAVATLVEPLGDLMDVTLNLAKLPSQPLVARVPWSPDVRAGGAVWVEPSLRDAHWFEPGPTGSRIG